MADSVYTSLGDSKNRILIGSNPITRNVDVGTRIMVTNKTVYRVTNLTDFEYNGRFIGDNGLISTLVLQTSVITEDDKINNIAYNPISKNGDCKIKGKDYIYLSSENKYEVEYEGEVEFILDFDYINVVITSQENNKCIIRHNDSMDYIGDSMSLIARNKETKETIDMKNILVKGV